MGSRDGEPVLHGEMHAHTVHPVVFGCLCCWSSMRRDLVWLHVYIRVFGVWHMAPCTMRASCHPTSRGKWKLRRRSCAGWWRAEKQDVVGKAYEKDKQTRQKNEAKQAKRTRMVWLGQPIAPFQYQRTTSLGTDRTKTKWSNLNSIYWQPMS
jgi:hypothetical protein